MKKFNNRQYNCKDEELIPIAKFIHYSLNRDLTDFSRFSGIYTPEYVTGLEQKITKMEQLVEPQSETLAKKQISQRIYASINALVDHANHLTGYLELARHSLSITPSEFGIAALRKSINIKDAEGVVNHIRIVLSNITLYKNTLMGVGLTENIIESLRQAADSIAADKQLQYEITTNRKSLVQNNLDSLNGLYNQLCEIMVIGKILYKATDKVKLSEYTFADLIKKVRQVPVGDKSIEAEPVKQNN